MFVLPPMKVLLVEDDREISSFVHRGLKEAGFTVDSAADGRQGLQLALENLYDAMIVDIMLPEIDGLTLIQTIRQNNMSAPVLILSAKRSVDDKVRGFQTGGDDYLTKPFSFAELLARVQALIRRSSTLGPSSPGPSSPPWSSRSTKACIRCL